MTELLPAPLALVPVLAFLTVLVFLDSFKLLPFRAVLRAILAGAVAAAVCYGVNSGLSRTLPLDDVMFRRYIAPFVEEIAKGLYLVFLIRSARVGFLVDAAIAGFAVGAGFAVVENVNYLLVVDDPNLYLWVVRGFGTAIMHGSVGSIFAILGKSMADRTGSRKLSLYLPGWSAAFAIHSSFNHFLLHPLVSTALLLVVLPPILVLVFERSEAATRRWLGTGFDTDVELLELITGKSMAGSNVGRYLESLKHHFPGRVVGDLLCLLRIHLELSIRAKGILLARAAGLRVRPDDFVRANLEELRYLEKSVGPTGRLALAPFLNMTGRDLWKLYMLEEEHTTASGGRG